MSFSVRFSCVSRRDNGFAKRVSENIGHFLDREDGVVMALLDFSKACNTVDQS